MTLMRLEQPGERARAQEYRALRAALVDQFEMMDMEHQVRCDSHLSSSPVQKI
jgi:hypothetical protein